MGSCASVVTEPERNYHTQESPTPTILPNSLNESGFLNIPSWFPPQNAHRNISKLLQIKSEIGKGDTGSVFTGFYNEQECAIKRIKQDAFGAINFSTEAHALSALHHPSIIGYIDMLMDDTYYYLVLDRADYDLYQLMSHKRSLSERRTKRIIYSILSGLQYIHSNSIVHRDLKPENVVFKAGEKDRAMLIDFGDAEMVICDKTYTEFVGTPCYMSPERLGKHNGEQLKKSDVWAVGVIAYELYSGSRCFKGGTQRRVFSRVLRGDWSWNQHRKPKQNMQDFVSKCLNPRWQHRMSANEALKHQWFADMTKLDEDTERTTMESDVSSMDNCNDDRVAIPRGASPLDEYDTVRMESFESLNDLLGNVGP